MERAQNAYLKVADLQKVVKQFTERIDKLKIKAYDYQ